MRFDAVIFDLDGTLIDSMGVWKKIDADFLARRGLEVPPDYFGAISAMNFRETALYTVERFGFDDTPDDLMREWSDMASYEYGHSIALKPHAGDYVKHLRSKGVKLAVATSSPAELCEAVLINNGIRGLFDAVCASGAAARGKEFPDIFLRAAEELGAPPESCLVFEDILPAILSAKRARMSAWAIYDETSGDRWEEIKLASDGFIYDFIDAPLPV